MILEPKKLEKTGGVAKYNLRPSEELKLKAMYEAINKDRVTQKILHHAGNNLEVVRTWIDPLTQLTCKGLLDIAIPKFSEVSDLKTTAAKSRAEYIEMLNDYDYDRQTGFYAMGAKAKRVRIIGVQKVAPFNVFHAVSYTHLTLPTICSV